MTGSLPGEYFDALYATDADPWGLSDRWYEQRKYACTLAALPQQRYHRGYEPGCSIGVLTALLAPRCDRLLATDVSSAALSTAGSRLASFCHVEVEQRRVPEQWPAGSFDLITISELGYYFGEHDLQRLWDAALTALEPGGTLLAVHWRHPVADYPQTGDTVHASLAAQPSLARMVTHVEEDFRLEVYVRTPPAPRSVATQTGLR